MVSQNHSMVIFVVNDRVVGAGLVAVSVIVIIVYNALLFIPIFKGIDILLLKLTAAVAVTAAFALLGWIGYTLATAAKTNRRDRERTRGRAEEARSRDQEERGEKPDPYRRSGRK